MKVLTDELSDAVGKKEENDVQIKEFNVSAHQCLNDCYNLYIDSFSASAHLADKQGKACGLLKSFFSIPKSFPLNIWPNLE